MSHQSPILNLKRINLFQKELIFLKKSTKRLISLQKNHFVRQYKLSTHCTGHVEIKLEPIKAYSWVAFIPWLLQRYNVELCQILEWSPEAAGLQRTRLRWLGGSPTEAASLKASAYYCSVSFLFLFQHDVRKKTHVKNVQGHLAVKKKKKLSTQTKHSGALGGKILSGHLLFTVDYRGQCSYVS